MKTKSAVVSNKLGMHARASTKIVNLVSRYEAEVRMSTEEGTADASSIMDLLMIAGCEGTAVEISVSAEDPELEEKILGELLDLFERKFDEGE